MSINPINESFIKVSSKTPIERKLEIGEQVKLAVVGEVVKTEILSRQDGSVDCVAIVKPVKIEVI